MSGRAGIVLCGGRSSRMGRPKPWLPWRGRPMLAHVVGVLREAVDEVVVVGAPGADLPHTDARVVRDRRPHLGPLAGIREGLLAIGAERAYVTGTDAPLLSPAFVRALLAQGEPVAAEVDGFVQPLAAVYARAWADRAEELLAAGRGSALALLEAGGFRRVPSLALPDRDSLCSLDTPQAYLDALRRDVPGACAFVQWRERQAEVPVGTLGEVLSAASGVLAGVDPRALTRTRRVALAGCGGVRDLQVPVGCERVRVLDSPA
jgi:molybdopterin-guanine dinucleotide biosynthesis protein A